MAMKRRTRVLLIVAAVLLTPVLILGGLLAATFGGLEAIEDSRRVGATIEIVRDGYVSASILDLGNGHVALIDCGNDPMGVALLAALSHRNLGPADVSTIFLTHGHRDHVAACPLFAHADVYALEADVPLAEGRTMGHSPIAHVMSPSPTGVHVGHPLADGDVVSVGNAEVHAYAVPGHTEGSAAYLVDGTLFIGDSGSVTSDRHLRGAPWLFSDDQALNITSMRALGERLQTEHESVTTIVAAHTGVLDDTDVLAALRSM